MVVGNGTSSNVGIHKKKKKEANIDNLTNESHAKAIPKRSRKLEKGVMYSSQLKIANNC